MANRPPDPEGEERATLELARTIVGLGVDIDAIDNRGNTALHHAVIKNFPSVVEFLIAGGAEIDLANDRDQTPLILAETAQTFPGTNGLRGTRPEVAEVLRRLGASD